MRRLRRAEKATQRRSPAKALERQHRAAEVSQRSSGREEGIDGWRLFGPIYLLLIKGATKGGKRQVCMSTPSKCSPGDGHGVLTILLPPTKSSVSSTHRHPFFLSGSKMSSFVLPGCLRSEWNDVIIDHVSEAKDKPPHPLRARPGSLSHGAKS